MTDRTSQDLLAERRLLVLEREREHDEIARALLAYYIADIDLTIADRAAAAHPDRVGDTRGATTNFDSD